ncbi:MAG TPA: hypothetical protein VLX92_34555 [Kofleriaceae bacterium]|nr:hypothetical protein [Kofleriaceae bacterium]
MRRLVLACALAACAHPAKPPPPQRVELGAGGEEADDVRRKRLVAELQDEILSSYERDDLPEVDTELIPPTVGPARIGAGPGDVLFGDDVRQRASSRWPLYLGPAVHTEVRSKRLDIHLSKDKQVSAAWMSDELSWRIEVCGHMAAIPLRITALYAHDGDRWVEVFEHLSYARVPVPYPGGMFGLPMIHPHEDPIVDRRLADQLSGVLASLMSRSSARILSVVSLDPQRLADEDPSQPAPTMLLAPDPDGEWHGTDDISRAQLVDGALRAEDRRIGTVGPSVARSSIAYWVGNFVAELPSRPGVPAGKVRLRGTFIFEKRNDKWIVVQGHVSEAIDDYTLAQSVFGTALAMTEQDILRKKPLAVLCDAPEVSAIPGAARSARVPEAGNR